MRQVMFRVVGLPAALLLLGLGAGCATSGDVDAAKKMAEEAKTSAEQANSTAQQAVATAKEESAPARGR